MAKLVLALDKQSWEIAPPEHDDTSLCDYYVLHKKIDDYLHSGVDGIKMTDAAFFTGVYDSVYGTYRNYRNQFRHGKYYGSERPFPKIDVFLDLKIADIHDKNNKGTNFKIAQAIARCTKGFVTHTNVHGISSGAVREVVAGCQEGDLKTLVLCALTDESYDVAYHIDREGAIAVYENALNAKEEGAYGLILPGNHHEYLTPGVVGLGMPIWCPGFGRQDRKKRDIYEQLSSWRALVGDNPEHAAIIGTHLLEHPNLDEEIKRIKEIIK